MKEAVIVEYLPNYKMKYSFFKEPIREDEGGGWYSIKGYKLCCSVSKIYTLEGFKLLKESELDEERLKLFQEEKNNYESSKPHKDRLKSFLNKM